MVGMMIFASVVLLCAALLCLGVGLALVRGRP